MGEKGLVGHLGLVVGPDPIPVFMVSHWVMEDHNLQCLSGFIMGELALVDESSYPGI